MGPRGRAKGIAQVSSRQSLRKMAGPARASTLASALSARRRAGPGAAIGTSEPMQLASSADGTVSRTLAEAECASCRSVSQQLGARAWGELSACLSTLCLALQQHDVITRLLYRH